MIANAMTLDQSFLNELWEFTVDRGMTKIQRVDFDVIVALVSLELSKTQTLTGAAREAGVSRGILAQIWRRFSRSKEGLPFRVVVAHALTLGEVTLDSVRVAEAIIVAVRERLGDEGDVG